MKPSEYHFSKVPKVGKFTSIENHCSDTCLIKFNPVSHIQPEATVDL